MKWRKTCNIGLLISALALTGCDFLNTGSLELGEETSDQSVDREGDCKPDDEEVAANNVVAPDEIDPGRVTLQRLNRFEYNNTVRDLLGITSRPADNFPEDDFGYGFNNNGDVLSLSPLHLESYHPEPAGSALGHRRHQPGGPASCVCGTCPQHQPAGRTGHEGNDPGWHSG